MYYFRAPLEMQGQVYKMSMFHRGKEFPKLRGKAGEIRHVGAAFLSLWETYCTRQDIHTKITTLLKIDLKIDRILDEYHPADGFYALPSSLSELSLSWCTCKVKHACITKCSNIL